MRSLYSARGWVRGGSRVQLPAARELLGGNVLL
jgi:hypothetical protein